jgi:predicted Rossmann fold nucleotide-binding protein DprA/Smf involved in DNA uptake
MCGIRDTIAFQKVPHCSFLGSGDYHHAQNIFTSPSHLIQPQLRFDCYSSAHYGGSVKKRIIALTAAILMTACVGIAMLAIGGAALFNKNGAVAANSSSEAAKTAQVNAQKDAEIQQLQDLVAQYQAREQEYAQREQQLQSLLDQANTQVQQFQQQIQQVQALLQYLQSRGVIFITNDGRITVN